MSSNSSTAESRSTSAHDKETIIALGPWNIFHRREDRLVVKVFNRANEPLKFIGEQSSMVDHPA